MFTPRIFTNNYVDDLFDEMFNFPTFANTGMSNNLMNTDVKDLGDKYELDIELPGFKKEDVHAELNNGYLTISAAHTEKHDEKKHGRFVRKERYTGQCQRNFYVGESVTQEDIKGKFDNGVLTLEFPKMDKAKEVEQKKYIAIE